MLQSLKQVWAQLYKGSILPGIQHPRLAGIVLAADLVTSLLLFYAGQSIALSHITGFAVSGAVLLLAKYLQPSAKTDFKVARFWHLLAYSILQLALRAGLIASLTLAGVNTTPALLLGIVLAGLVGNFSTALLLNLPPRNTVSDNTAADENHWLLSSLVLILGVFTLRLAFFGGMEVIPQEAYYWNYAQHLSPGYLDHPPLVAATIWSGEALLGHGALGTRFGAILYGLLFIGFFYRYARLQVDTTSALAASALALCLPYFFMGSGFLMTPDAPLTLAWVMALYFFYRALVDAEKNAWYGVGLAMGLGMLSKYSIALLAPAAAAFILIDPQARRVLLSKEPYLAVLVAMVVFAPVIYWNASHDWASFSFQSSGRFDEEPKFYLDMMLGNIVAIVTPLPLLALPYLFTKKITHTQKADTPFNTRVRLFIGCFLLVPMSVFAWNALKYEPRYNWTGPLWITLLPMLAWLMVNADRLRWRPLAGSLKAFGKPLLFTLICLYAVLLHFLSIGLPGIDYPRGMARLIGWPQVARDIEQLREAQPDKDNVVIAGLDKYFISSKLAYYGTPEFLGKNRKLEVTGIHLLEGNSLMFAYWHPAEEFRGKTVIMLARSRSDLETQKLAPYFERLSAQITAFPVYRNDFGLPQKTIRDYYYRIGYNYAPPAAQAVVDNGK